MEHISKILKNKKVIDKHFVCPRTDCKEDNAYTFFDWESRKTKFRCPTCGLEDYLHNLSYLTKQYERSTP